LLNACVDLNPHQIDAALFALKNPLSKGVVLADEVGLRKTIEAALVICQYWAERRQRHLVIYPAVLRKQWALELAEKFHLPSQILDARTWKQIRADGVSDPLIRYSITKLLDGVVRTFDHHRLASFRRYRQFSHSIHTY